LQDPVSKKPITKKGLMEWHKMKGLSSSPSTAKQKQKQKQKQCRLSKEPFVNCSRPALWIPPREKVPPCCGPVFFTTRLGEFLKTETDGEISAQPDFEDQTLDFSDVDQLMGAINTIPGASLISAPRVGVPGLCER
jgi:hypothetical protein